MDYKELTQLLQGKTILGVHSFIEDMDNPNSPKGIGVVVKDEKGNNSILAITGTDMNAKIL